MKLLNYLKQKEQSAAAFARAIGVLPMQVHRYIHGVSMPPPEVMKVIRKNTRGKVQPNDFYTGAK